MAWMCWHKWGRWAEYEWRGIRYGSPLLPVRDPVKFSEHRQKRTCEKCGKVQDEKIL